MQHSAKAPPNPKAKDAAKKRERKIFYDDLTFLADSCKPVQFGNCRIFRDRLRNRYRCYLGFDDSQGTDFYFGVKPGMTPQNNAWHSAVSLAVQHAQCFIASRGGIHEGERRNHLRRVGEDAD